MKKIRAAIIGYGNIGKYVLEALEVAPDFEIAGVVRRDPSNVPSELSQFPVVDHITKLENVDVAILATPTRKVEQFAKEVLALGINTVDSFDIHGQIADLRKITGTAAACRACPTARCRLSVGLSAAVRQLFISLVNLFKFFCRQICQRIVYIIIRMIFFNKLPVRLFYFLIAGALFQPQHFIVISFLCQFTHPLSQDLCRENLFILCKQDSAAAFYCLCAPHYKLFSG